MHAIFPDPRTAPPDGPLAVGDDLRPATLVEAYRQGIFPWPDGRGSIWWWSPDPRAVFPVGGVHRSRSLRRRMRTSGFSTTTDTSFEQVVRGCAVRPGEGTWITQAMREAYAALHRLGHAHSVEVWDGDRLVGGIYGVAIGGVFTGESMFHRERDASKIALATLDDHLADRGFGLLDAQLHTDHLERMGAELWPRSAFLDVLAGLRDAPVSF
ncbi:leucyl/phenylalanyl-tRNA--protein transferase [Euzebya sp.]|uniref:leucyl/phenylalanyl-tRNA--protein transferase n=1 Tax=Euzebya sp. TaxID=1971409 RepID=UPI003514E164